MRHEFHEFALMGLIALIGLTGCKPKNQVDLAKQDMVQVCSNKVTGICRIVECDLDPTTLGGAITNWKGSAAVEFINEQGGISRTNLEFRFFAMTNDDGSARPCAYYDPSMMRRDFEARLKAIEARK